MSWSYFILETNDLDIINVIVSHDNFQRQKIQSAYEDMYKRSLVDDLEEETGGFFLDTALALLKPAHQLDTQKLYLSISVSHRHSVNNELLRIAMVTVLLLLKLPARDQPGFVL